VTKKRRKLVAFVLLAVVGGVVAYGLLQEKEKEKDEPKYQGRYLSEWLEEYAAARSVDLPRRAETEAAVRSIGTNALPYFLKWIANEPFDVDIERRRACLGFAILGSNAVSAVPGLLAIITTPPKREYYPPGVLDPYTAAGYALQSIGESAVPTLKTALADPNQTNRDRIIDAFKWTTAINPTNVYLWVPTVEAALKDPDAKVSHQAEYVLFGGCRNLCIRNTNTSSRTLR